MVNNKVDKNSPVKILILLFNTKLCGIYQYANSRSNTDLISAKMYYYQPNPNLVCFESLSALDHKYIYHLNKA